METVGNWWMWVGFTGIVLVMLAIDLFVVGGGKQHRVSMREAAAWSGIWVGVSFIFAGALWWYLDGAAGRAVANESALEFITGYLIEKSLAVDNVFVWLMLFSFFESIEEGYRLISRAIEAKPDSYAIQDSMGWALVRLGRLDEGRAWLETAWDRSEDPEVAAHLGETFWLMGRIDKARRIWDEALAANPDSRPLLRAIERHPR